MVIGSLALRDVVRAHQWPHDQVVAVARHVLVGRALPHGERVHDIVQADAVGDPQKVVHVRRGHAELAAAV